MLNSTQVPNSILEAIYSKDSEFTEAEKDMLLLVCRQTIGWQKEMDWLTLKRIEQLTGKTKNNTSPVLKSLVKKGAITAEKRPGTGWMMSLGSRWAVLQDRTPSSAGQNSTVLQDRTDKINSYKIYPTKLSDEGPKWEWGRVLKSMEEGKSGRHMPIIALYWKKKGVVFENGDQYAAQLKRLFRPASALKGYDLARISKVMDALECMERDWEWTLETVIKRIDEPSSGSGFVKFVELTGKRAKTKIATI